MGLFAHANTAPLYWRILSRLYVMTFESDRLRVLKDDAVEVARAAWVEHRLASAARGEDIPDVIADDDPTSGTPVSVVAASSEYDRDWVTARYLLSRCVRTGWVHLEFQREHNDDAVHFTPTAARTIDVWLREARDEQPPLQGYLLNIKTLLAHQAVTEKPSVAIVTANRVLRDFARELAVLSQDISRSIDRVLQEAATPQAVLHEALDRYGRRVSGNYHRIKTVENVHRVRAELVQRIDEISMDSNVLRAAAKDWAEREQAAIDDGIAEMVATLGDMRDRLAFLPTLLRDLDDRNARFSGAAFRQLVYLLHQDAQLESKLESALRRLTAGSSDDRTHALSVEVYRFRGLAHHSSEAATGVVGDDAVVDTNALALTPVGSVAFLYRQPAPSVPVPREPVAASSAALSVESAQSLAQRLANALTPTQLDAWTTQLLGYDAARHVRDIPLASVQQFIRAVVVIAWAQRGQGISRFERLTCQ
ncbi:MAG: Wadjet anti-phage system protein JetA family protein, partial [bacterium]